MQNSRLWGLFVLLLIGSAFISPPIPVNIWDTLSQIKWKKEYNSEFEARIDRPEFKEAVKALDGKVVDIPGFIIPYAFYGDKDSKYIVLSRYPTQSCFFCGGAGPESVVEVYLKKRKLFYRFNRVTTIRGTLQLNNDDYNHLIYILKDAEIVRK